MGGVHVKKEPEEIPSTSHQDPAHIQLPQHTQPMPVASNQVTHTLVDGSTNAANGHTTAHIVTRHDGADLASPMQIAQVQGLPAGTHQLTLGNLNQVGFRSDRMSPVQNERNRSENHINFSPLCLNLSVAPRNRAAKITSS